MKMGRPKKITAEVSSSIETLSSLDSTLTNFEIRIVAVRHFPSGTCLHTPATAVAIFWTASARRGFVASAWTAVYALAKHRAVFVHDRVLAACSARAESGDARVRRRHAR
jgi:hypothetical protein